MPCASDKVGLGQRALRGKEYRVAIKASGKGPLLETLHYEEDLRKADPYFTDIPSKKADPDLLEVATALIDKKTDKFDASVFKHHHQAALRELIGHWLKSKDKGKAKAVDNVLPKAKSPARKGKTASLPAFRSPQLATLSTDLPAGSDWVFEMKYDGYRCQAAISKAKRKGKLFIDYLRNERGSTAIAPWSPRSREGAPVAVPVTWDELKTVKAANQFTLADAATRAKQPDPWKGYVSITQSIPKTMLNKLEGG